MKVDGEMPSPFPYCSEAFWVAASLVGIRPTESRTDLALRVMMELSIPSGQNFAQRAQFPDHGMIDMIGPADTVRTKGRIAARVRIGAAQMALLGAGAAFSTDFHIDLQKPGAVFYPLYRLSYPVQFRLTDCMSFRTHCASLSKSAYCWYRIDLL